MSDQPTQPHPNPDVTQEQLDGPQQDVSASPPQQVQSGDILPAPDQAEQVSDDQFVEVPDTASDEEKAVQDPTDRPDYADEKSPALLDSGDQEGSN